MRTPGSDPDGIDPPTTLRLQPPVGVTPALTKGQPRWARVASGAGWTPPEVLYLVEQAAATTAVQDLVETLAGVLPYDLWLLVAHEANALIDVSTSLCPCHRLAAPAAGAMQDGLW